MRWHFLNDRKALRAAVVANLTDAANAAIATRGAFHIVLAGGCTPKSIYEKLRDIDTDWNRWYVYFGDERCLPRSDAERNDTMARDSLLDHVPIPPAQIFSIPAELGAEQAANEYARQIHTVDEFDLVLLGLGEDGHTASLFPGISQKSHAAAIAVHAAPKPPSERVSLSASRLSAAHAVWFLVAGEDKRDALLRWRRGEDIPAARISPAAGIDIYTDVELPDQR